MTESDRGHSQRPPWLGEDKRTWDHVRIHVQLARDERLGADEIAVYFGLAIHAELSTGKTRPAQETLAGYTKLTIRRVRDAMRCLEQAEYIQVDRRPGKAAIVRLLPPPVLKTSGGGVEVIDADTSSGSDELSPDLVRVSRTSPSGGDDEPKPDNKKTTEHLTNDSSSTPSSREEGNAPSLGQPKKPSREELKNRAELLLEAFCVGSGRKPGTKVERARWLAGAQQLASEDACTPQTVRLAAERMRKEWSTIEAIHPHNLAKWWSRFHKVVVKGKHWNPACGDHEPWMDAARIEPVIRPEDADWYERIQKQEAERVWQGGFLWNRPVSA